MTVKTNDYGVVIAKYRFIEMIVHPKDDSYYFYFLFFTAHDYRCFGNMFTCPPPCGIVFGSFLFSLFFFNLSPGFLFHFGSSSKYIIATMKKLERYYMIIVITLYNIIDIPRYLYVRILFYFSLSLSACLRALSNEKHLLDIIVVDFCTTCRSRTLAYNSRANVPLTVNVTGGPPVALGNCEKGGTIG